MTSRSLLFRGDATTFITNMDHNCQVNEEANYAYADIEKQFHFTIINFS
jgi:hypothetical protein